MVSQYAFYLLMVQAYFHNWFSGDLILILTFSTIASFLLFLSGWHRAILMVLLAQPEC